MGRKKNYIKIPVKPLLSAITAENKTVESVLRNINVNEDYVTDFPTDDLGKEINKDLNFLQLFNDLFVWLCDYLLKRKMYEGYNFHKYGDKIVNGKPIVCLAGTADKNKFDFLQVW